MDIIKKYSKIITIIFIGIILTALNAMKTFQVTVI